MSSHTIVNTQHSGSGGSTEAGVGPAAISGSTQWRRELQLSLSSLEGNGLQCGMPLRTILEQCNTTTVSSNRHDSRHTDSYLFRCLSACACVSFSMCVADHSVETSLVEITIIRSPRYPLTLLQTPFLSLLVSVCLLRDRHPHTHTPHRDSLPLIRVPSVHRVNCCCPFVCRPTLSETTCGVCGNGRSCGTRHSK